MSSQQSRRDYINFLKSTVEEHKSNVISSASAIAIAIVVIFLFKEHEIIIYGCMAVISYCLMGFLLGLIRTRQWQRTLDNATDDLDADIQADRVNLANR